MAGPVQQRAQQAIGKIDLAMGFEDELDPPRLVARQAHIAGQRHLQANVALGLRKRHHGLEALRQVGGNSLRLGAHRGALHLAAPRDHARRAGLAHHGSARAWRVNGATCRHASATARGRADIPVAQIADDLRRSRQIGRIGQPDQHHFRRDARTRGGLHLLQTLEQNLPRHGERANGQRRREGRAAFALAGRERGILAALRRELQPRHDMHEFRKIREDRHGVGAGIILAFEFGEGGGDIALHHRLEEVDDARAIREAQRGTHGLRLDIPAAMGDRLIHQRERVAHRAFGSTRDEAKSLALDLNLLLRSDASEIGDHLLRLDAAQVEALAAREHRHRHLADFGRREQEFHMRRRLFQRLQQAVEGGGGEHVHFVDDVDLGAAETGL